MDDLTYSDWWRIVSVASKPELYVTPYGLRETVHVSFHPDGVWHVKVIFEGDHRHPIVAHEMKPGVKHLLQIQTPPLGLYRPPGPPEVTWVPPPPTPSDSTFFEVLHGCGRSALWPVP